MNIVFWIAVGVLAVGLLGREQKRMSKGSK